MSKQLSQPSRPTWAEVATFPLKLYHTPAGAFIGRVDPRKSSAATAMVYAPARVSTPTPVNVAFTPIAFCDNVFKLNLMQVLGSTDIPEVIAKAYDGYFGEFVKGGYRMNTVVVAGVGVDAPDEAVAAMTAELPQQPNVIVVPETVQ